MSLLNKFIHKLSFNNFNPFLMILSLLKLFIGIFIIREKVNYLLCKKIEMTNCSKWLCFKKEDIYYKLIFISLILLVDDLT